MARRYSESSCWWIYCIAQTLFYMVGERCLQDGSELFLKPRKASEPLAPNLQRGDDDGNVYRAAVIISNLHLPQMTDDSVAGAASDRLTCQGLIPMFHVACATLWTEITAILSNNRKGEKKCICVYMFWANALKRRRQNQPLGQKCLHSDYTIWWFIQFLKVLQSAKTWGNNSYLMWRVRRILMMPSAAEKI